MPERPSARRWVLGAMLSAPAAMVRTLGAGAAFAASSACTTWPAPSTPMPVRRIAARCPASARCVLLPGVASRAEDFIGQGFVADLHAAAPACEVLLADAHLGYLIEGQLITRLREDVVRPGATDAAGGAIKPWLVGISLGGFAALAYAMRHGEQIAGVVALAPYLGRRTLLRDISAAGGPLAWRERPQVPGEPYETIEDELWRWLAQPGRGGAPGLPIYLGFGRDDRFADAQRLLQSLLPAGSTHTVAGGHDWPPWRALWQQWLPRGLLVGVGCASTA